VTTELDSKSILPESLKDLWDDELKALLAALNFQQQSFALDYLEQGVASKAVEKAYGLKGPSAWARGSFLLRDVNVRAFITAYRAKDVYRREDDKEAIRATFRAAMLAETSYVAKAKSEDDNVESIIIKEEDHDTRIKAAQALAKLDGHNEAEKVQDDRFTALVNLMNTRGKNGKEKA
jgi:hypothetical protein